MTLRRSVAGAVAAVMLAWPLAGLAADTPNDSFIAGYAAAVLERELSIKADGLTVHDGQVTIVRPPLSPADKQQLLKTLSSIPGVKGVTVVNGEARTAGPQHPMEPLTVERPADALTLSNPSGNAAPATGPAYDAPSAGTTLAAGDGPVTQFLGAGRTFSPLLADPRWPHLYASYNHYSRDIADTHLQDVGSVGFGETVNFIRQTYPSGFRWELGIQGGLFAIFDLDSDSADLINADYFVGPYVAVRQGNFSVLGRIYHQSSHLGDEYLLRPEHEPRVNYSYEAVNLIASYDLPYGFRVYGGGEYEFDLDPDGLDHLKAEYGVEWVSPTTVPGTTWLRPVAALDVQNRETNDWSTSFSLRAGVQLEDPARFTQRVQLLFEFFDGNSPNGQFYDDHVRYYGIGAHFYF